MKASRSSSSLARPASRRLRDLGLAGLLFACLPLGCGTFGGTLAGSSGGAEFGATQGGVQDLSFARGLVTAGVVPPPESILVEAMFSEHDLPVPPGPGGTCAELLCLRGAVGVAPNAQLKPAVWAQVGLSSSVDPDTYKRPPLALVAAVDVSGSMAWDYGAGSPGDLAEALLYELTGELGAADRFAMVTYGASVGVPLGWTPGGASSIPQAIAALHEDGSTDMESGLQRAFEVAAEQLGQGREVRVVLFTDAQPNVGATSASSFEQLSAAAANEGIGLTVLGLGLGMGAEVVRGMSHLRGGNAFSFTDLAQVEGFLGENWPWFAVPIAYDLSVGAAPTAGLTVQASYGFPESASGPSAALEVTSVFLSKRRGALLLELGPLSDAPIASGAGVELSLSYEDRAGNPHAAALSPGFDGAPVDERGVAMPGAGTARAVSLALFTSELRGAVELYAADPAGATLRLDAALDRLGADAAATSDPELEGEAQFWVALSALMASGAKQGDLYGG